MNFEVENGKTGGLKKTREFLWNSPDVVSSAMII